eukprot:scaffold8023_cov103-Isochrysis_galbana.AAC.25
MSKSKFECRSLPSPVPRGLDGGARQQRLIRVELALAQQVLDRVLKLGPHLRQAAQGMEHLR